jgi:diguanylate cyclase (GGDEF)-like protein
MKLKKKWLVIFPVTIALIVFLVVYFAFNRTDENNFTVQETNWINENKNSLIDIATVSDYPVFGESGVFKDFLTDFSNATGFNFNNTSVLKESTSSSIGYAFKIVNPGTALSNNDLFLQDDIYTLFGRGKNRIDDFDMLGEKTIGLMSGDSDEVMYYLKKASDLKFKPYDDSDSLFKDYEDEKIDYVIVPYVMYLNKTIGNDKYNINYVFPELSKKIVLSLSSDNNNAKMNEIVRKYFNTWKENKYVKSYNTNLLDYYVRKFKINDKDKAEFMTKTYVYGYVENYPYEVKDKQTLSGIAAEYALRMNRLTNNELFTFKKYDSVEKLKEAVERKEVDIYFNYFDYEDANYDATISPFIEKYVVLSKLKSNYVVNSFESMKGLKVSILTNNSIYNYFKDNSKANLVPEDSLKALLKNAGDNLIVVDKEIYTYYKNKEFANYEVLFEDTITNDYNFMIMKDDTNTVFKNIFNYVIGTNSYYNYRNAGYTNLTMSVLEKSSFEELYIIILSIVFIPLIIVGILFLYFKHRKKIKTVKKEERRKYTDLFTSLKNRNYLNFNIQAWNESKKFPKSVIIVDLNNVKYVNDNYGHEQGDKLILGAASILINTQLENSELIRSDGNEFLLYLVGYSENQISTYTKKLTKEFKNLPYGFGAAVGYSMITDEIKTIDDAINEATIEMRKDKEEYK